MTGRLRWSDVTGLLEAAGRGALRGVAARWQDLLAARRLVSAGGPRRFRELVELLGQIYRGDGLRVVCEDADGRAVASTRLTADGDVFSRVSPRLFDDPELWRDHLKKLRRQLSPLEQVPALEGLNPQNLK